MTETAPKFLQRICGQAEQRKSETEQLGMCPSEPAFMTDSSGTQKCKSLFVRTSVCTVEGCSGHRTLLVRQSESYGTPSYYVQKLFSVNKGQNCCVFQADAAHSRVRIILGIPVLDETVRNLIIKIVNSRTKARPIRSMCWDKKNFQAGQNLSFKETGRMPSTVSITNDNQSGRTNAYREGKQSQRDLAAQVAHVIRIKIQK